MSLTPQEYCRQASERSGSNFLLAFKLLPQARREALQAFYTLCRELDDIADEPERPVAEKQAALALWENDIALAYEQRATLPALQALQPHLQSMNISRVHLLEIVEGVKRDLTQHRYADFAALDRYCYLVAGAVGIVCTRIFGCQNPASDAYAKLLGTAFQLTNILRDIGTDLRQGRIYLPQEELRAAGISEESLRDGERGLAFMQFMHSQYERAADYYARAEAAMPMSDYQALLPARLMARYYRAILEKVRRTGYDVLGSKRLRLSPFYKLWMLARFLPLSWAAGPRRGAS